DNLQPGTTYSYRVGSENGWSPIGSFTTAKSSKEPFSFIYLTDTQANTMDMFGVSQKTIHAAQRQVKDAQFLLVTGDLVESSGSTNSEWEWEQWFSNMQDVWYNLPIVPTQGNHDTSTNNNFAHHFNTDNSFNQTAAVGTAMNGTVYSFVYGDALFLMINYEDYAKEGYFKALTAWMEKQVAEHANVKWRIACYHKNMFTGSGSHQSDKDGKLVRENMLAVFDKLDIDLALQGHDHIYEVIGPVSNAAKTLVPGAVEHVETVTGNIRENMTGKQGGTFDVSNGTLYFLNNSAGKKKYEPRNESAMIAAIGDHAVNNYWGLFSGKFGQTGEPTFSDIKVSSDKIVISTYTVDGLGIPTLFDSFTLKKDKAVTSVMNVPEAEKVSIYPNPATEVINIGGVTADKVELFSTGGERVQQVSAGNQVNVSSLANGIYIVKVTAGQDTYFSKIVKK
ncbi:MAG: T9SS type A sorting domain-containing protein, partial [Tannerellaceae bacterium]